MADTMRRLRSTLASGALGMLALWSGSCTTVRCPDGKYAPGPEGCPMDLFVARASFSMDFMDSMTRKDLRSNPADGLPIFIQAQSPDLKTTYKIVEVPQVVLTLDDIQQPDATVRLDADRVVVSRTPDNLDTGLLSAQVTLPGLRPGTTDKPLRLFRGPKFGAPETVLEIFNQRHAIPIRARVSVQIVNPTGGPGRLLVSEESQCPSWWPDMTKCGGAPFYRWLDLYSPASSGTDSLVYANDSTWQAWYGAMQTSTSSLLAYAKGTVVRYDATRVPNPLSLWPQAGVMQDSFNNEVPKDAVALSACADESALLLTSPTEVRVFTFDANATVTQLGAMKTGGSSAAVVAARDVLGQKLRPRSLDYFAVVFESDGKVSLLKLGQPAMGLQMSAVTGPVGFGQVSAAALADLDSDGLQDLVVARSSDGTLMWSPQLQDGTFAAAAALTIEAEAVDPVTIKVPGASSISIGDLNNDGRPDLAVATTDKHLYVYRNQR